MMYTITRGPSKLVTQRRTGQTQQIDKINDCKHKQTPWSIPDSPAPKIVFNRLNGKKYHNTPAALLQVDPQPKEGFTSAHQENVKFIYEVRDHRKQFIEWTKPLKPWQFDFDRTPTSTLNMVVTEDVYGQWASGI
ncbi:unnamed protein product [Oncorhynchus mykiss]|uniref:Uncharacterized protein n=1 Tax=Oncorhynchus mykiss TaxID=8022 RepID=A0A060YH94_ONCMY|nr:unnamed protein product [Oncorhynchus mykiss]